MNVRITSLLALVLLVTIIVFVTFADATGAAVTVHNLLNGSEHPDTVAATADRGSLIIGNATGDWQELVVSTNTGDLLRSSGDGLQYLTPMEALAFKRNYAWGYQAPTGTNTSLGGNGLLDRDTVTGDSGGNINFSFTGGQPTLNFATSTAKNNRQGVSTNAGMVDDVSPLYLSQFESPSHLLVNFFTGFSESNFLTTLTGDLEDTAHLGLKFYFLEDAVAGPGNWVFTTSDGTTQSTADSAVTYTTSTIQYVEVSLSNADQTGTVTLYDDGLNLQASHTFSSNLPLFSPVTLQTVFGLRNESAGTARNASFIQAWLFARGD